MSLYKKYHFPLFLGLLLIISALLRFYDYGNRWGLAYDQAHDVIIARYALETHKFPLLGPFSSAGPFQTGGEWYWFIMIGTLLFPFFVNGPWVFLTLLQVFFPLLMVYVGYKLINKWFGLLVGVFAAISPDGISQSINLTNQSPLNYVSALSLLFAILYLKERKTKYLFWLGFFSTLGATIHLQGVPLIFIAIGTILLDRLKNKKGTVLLLLGGILPLLPLIYFDMTHHFMNVRNMIQYYFHDQYKISLDVLGRRWSTYLDKIWPDLWSGALGGNFWVGLALMVGSLGTFVWITYKRLITKMWVLSLGVFLVAVFLIRYTRTPIFHSYIMFLHPLIFLFSAFACYFLFTKQKIVGSLAIILVVFFTLQLDFMQIKNATNHMEFLVTNWQKVLITKYPNKQIALYDYKYGSTTYSFPLLLYLQYSNKISQNGQKVGFGIPNPQKDPNYKQFYVDHIIKENKVGFILVDLNSSSSAELSHDQWIEISPKSVYNATEQWYSNSK